MTSKLRTLALALALVATMALTAVTASSASAFLGFTSSVEKTNLHGVQTGLHQWTASAGSGFGAMHCETVTGSGTVTGTFNGTNYQSTGQTVKPTYSGCIDSFNRKVDIITNSLELILTVTGTNAEKTPIGQGHVKGHIEAVITSGTGASLCTITVSAAQTLNGITYHNHWEGTNDMLVTTKATGIINTTSGGFFNCGIANGEHNDGEYEGSTVIGGTSGGASVAITADGT